MIDPVVEVLAKQSKSRLNEMRAEAMRQIEDLRQQVEWIDRAMGEKSGPLLQLSPAVGRSSASMHLTAGPPRRRRNSGKRSAVQAIVGSEPGRVWSPAEIQQALNDAGMESTIESVRVLLRRMLDAGELGRGGPNRRGWILPLPESAPNGAAPEDQETSGAGFGPQSALAPTDGSG